jgi:hypothetical protein
MGVVKDRRHTGARRVNITFKIVNPAVTKIMSNSDNSVPGEDQFANREGRSRRESLCGG